ncbi:MAG: TrkA C-terminal domain-containing protein, partial [Bacteroidales bacterium]|nr:TrkA C-terminal domain-containing protein [Bacteroidales bacterium]
SPFIYKMVTKHLHSEESHEFWRKSIYQRVSLIVLFVARLLLGLMFVIGCISHYFTLTSGVLTVMGLVVVAPMLFSKKIHLRSSEIEQNFMSNLSAREVEQDRHRAVKKELEQQLLSYDLHLADFEISAESTYCGSKLINLDLRKTCGVNVVRIIRGGLNVNIPGGNERLFPHDRIVVSGSDEQIRLFQEQLQAAEKRGAELVAEQGLDSRRTQVSLEQLVVKSDMDFCGKTLAESRIREKAQCAVLGIEHDGITVMNPDASMVLAEGDTLLLAGESDQILQLLNA